MARMVIARIAGLSPGTSPPPVRTPIKPFLVLMFAIIGLNPDVSLHQKGFVAFRSLNNYLFYLPGRIHHANFGRPKKLEALCCVRDSLPRIREHRLNARHLEDFPTP